MRKTEKQDSGERVERMPKPSEFMRRRRPELYSDSEAGTEAVIDRALLEAFLDTLTTREQEKDFERFAKRLCELEVCPNLKPQTGPSGGGDGKIDGQTHPVDPDLALRAYWGSPATPTSERWGFAFSAKKKWTQKVRSDVDGAVGSGIAYTKIIFVTNQPARAKTRVEIEQELSQKYGIAVEILDRTWILDRVFDHGREELAIEYLHIPHRTETRQTVGPRDYARQQQLEEVLKRLGQPEDYGGDDHALAVDYLYAAKLARTLEKHRHEIEGLFSRARDLARRSSSDWLVFRSGYEHAWTCCWWYDDLKKVAELYDELAPLLDGTHNAYDFELLGNLWRVMFSGVRFGLLKEEEAKLKERLVLHKTNLERMAADRARPNNALCAQAELYLLQLTGAADGADAINDALDGLRKCLRRSKGLGTFPAMAIVKSLTELGDALGQFSAYDDLFAEMEKVAEERLGEAARGKLLLQRGEQLLESDPQQALRCFGGARVRLAKEETESLGVRASLGCCLAYASLGLLWAARMEAIGAAHFCLRDHDAVEELGYEAFLAVRRLAWFDLELGRIAPFLNWHTLARSLAAKLTKDGYATTEWIHDLQSQELVFGCYLLNLPLSEARELSDLVPGLEDADMFLARAALQFALGDREGAAADIPPEMLAETPLDELMGQWKTQPASGQVKNSLAGETRPCRRIEAEVMGVTLAIESSNSAPQLVLSENIAGMWEAALASADWSKLAFIVDRIEVQVDVEEGAMTPPVLMPTKDTSRAKYAIRCGKDFSTWIRSADRQEVSDYFMGTLLRLLLEATIDPMEDIKKELDRWHADDTFSRVLGLAPMAVTVADIAGEQYELKAWNGSRP